MNKVKSQKRPSRSLRNSLIFWFLVFSIVPLIFVTGFSLEKAELALDRELLRRMQGNTNEVDLTISDMEKAVTSRGRDLASDRALTYYLSTNKAKEIRSFLSNWIMSSVASRVSVIQADGRIIGSAYKDETGEVKSENLSSEKAYYIEDDLVERLNATVSLKLLESRKKSLELVAYQQVQSRSGRVVGFIEQVININEQFLLALKKRMELQLVIISPEGKVVVASNEDLMLYPKKFFAAFKGDNEEKIYDIQIRKQPYGFMMHPVSWGDVKFYVGLAAGKVEVKETLRNIKTAFGGVLFTVVLLVIVLTWFASNKVVKPLTDLYEGIRRTKLGEENIEIPVRNDTEMGFLTQSFNDMSESIQQGRNELRSKIKELETANVELRDAQTQLVHSAKMASLGQLVAGIAHELNNPIGFIYSNMSHLKDYSDRLVQLTEIAKAKPSDLDKKLEELEFDYIRQDMPRLIASCEEGAQRTRDIVMGLKSFSRLEEAGAKEMDIHEGIENTLKLLAGELKTRITVKKDFANIPTVWGFPSNLNQVFMNILSNAVHAIVDKGTIELRTWSKKEKDEEFVFVSIKDSGQGMSQEVVAKIFDPFFTTKSVGQGTGLGMSISFGIVKKHGGEITVKSKEGVGTEFIIKLAVKGPAARNT